MAEKLKLNFRAILFLASLLILSSCGGGGDGDNNPPLSNNSPLAGAGNDQTVSKSVIVTLDASESSDPDNDPLIYIWAQIGGTPVSLNDNTLEQPTFIAPDTPGVLVFSLTVNDGEFYSVADEIVVTVINNFPPVARAGTSSIYNGGETVILDGTGSSDPDGDPITGYSWAQISGAPVA